MIKETIHVVLEKRGILSFEMSVSHRVGQAVLITGALTQINGTDNIHGDSIRDLSKSYFDDFFTTHDDFKPEDYDNAMYIAKMKTRERLGYGC